MKAHCRLLIVAAGAVLAQSLATPASAAVSYDHEAKTGFVGAADVRKAFGWSAAELAARAADVDFRHDFWTIDHYVVTCGGKEVLAAEHYVQGGHFALTDVVVRPGGRGPAGGYAGGFRLDGPIAGVSGTSVAPAAGQPCPEPGHGPRIDRAHVVATTTGWALTVTSGDQRRELRSERSVRGE